MGKMKEHPRYNVLSFRVTDEELSAIEAARSHYRTMQDFLHDSTLHAVATIKDVELTAYADQT